MLSFKSILLAAAAFVSIVSAVPTPEVGNSLNVVQRSPQLPKLPATGAGTLPNVPALGGIPALGGATNSKRGGGKSCKEIFDTCHDGIAEIIVEIS